jgi:hypothetical protein
LDAPTPRGKAVTLTCYVDANLVHNTSTGHSATGILHLMNLTPIDWYTLRDKTHLCMVQSLLLQELQQNK